LASLILLFQNQRLKAENTLLRQMLEADTRQALELENALTSKISSLIKEYSSTRSKALQDNAQSLQDALKDSLKENESFTKQHPRVFDGLRAHSGKMTQIVTDHASRRRTAEQQVSKAVWAVEENVKAVMSEMSHEFGRVMDGQGREIRDSIETSSKDISAGTFYKQDDAFC
jgi:dsDNA-specific endonuclease/ATPase MutS2